MSSILTGLNVKSNHLKREGKKPVSVQQFLVALVDIDFPTHKNPKKK